MERKLPIIRIAVLILLLSIGNSLFAQNESIVLGRPTDTSMTASILFDQNVQYYLQYGTKSGNYSNTTTTYTNTANTPDEITMSGLQGDTRYYYKMFYKLIGASSYSTTPEYNFHTQRAKDSSFTFTLESDEHLYDYGSPALYVYTLQNEAKDKPDFMMSLGDIFGDDHTPTTTTAADMDSLHRVYRPRLGAITHSIPFFLSIGNHEGEKDYWLKQTPPNNIGVYGTLARKKYFPNPFPNTFYSGNNNPESYGIGLPEDYYSFTWGNALFVILDPYRFDCDTSAKPNGWNWTLGLTEYNWLQSTLQNSTAKFKFVFLHHPLGETRGGIVPAKTYEWGGYQGTQNKFAANRPGWAMPIHQLLVKYGVNVLFQGHDHLFAHETMDNVVYQEVPMAADATYDKGMLANASAYTADTLAGCGYIRVNVTSSCVKIDYVNSYLPQDTGGTRHNGGVAFSYTLGTCASLPVTFSSFTGSKETYRNILKWTTSNELNNNHYDVERSVDGSIYEKIGTVKGSGTTAGSNTYSFIDNLLVQQDFYYRLKQVDNDGGIHLSDVVFLAAKQTNLDVSITPNPATDKLNIIFPSNIKKHAISLINAFGQVVLETTENTINVKKFAKGVYIVHIDTELGVINQKVMIQ